MTASAGNGGGVDSAVHSRLLADPAPVAPVASVQAPAQGEIAGGASLEGSIRLEAPPTEVTAGGEATLDLGFGG